MSKSKGARYERELVNLFYDDGWFAQRVATSGSATDHELPDVQAARNGVVLVIELKYCADDNIYVDAEKVGGLIWLAQHLDAQARLVARWKGDATFYAWKPSDLEPTPSGNFPLRKSDRSDASVLPPKGEV